MTNTMRRWLSPTLLGSALVLGLTDRAGQRRGNPHRLHRANDRHLRPDR